MPVAGTVGREGGTVDVRRCGFSLLELLVVIGIIMLFLGLSIGAILRTPKVNALVATEHLVADVVRQARHTARSSGAPVSIEISKGDRTVMGVSQLMLWSDTFESVAAAGNSSPIGLTGKGLITDFLSGPTPVALPEIAVARDKFLARRIANAHGEGFYLTCSVKPPSATSATWTLPPPSVTTFSSDYIPLMLVGSDAVDQCTCGLALYRTTRTIQDQAHVSVPAPGSTPPDYIPELQCWDVVGWVNLDAGGRAVVSAINDVPTAVLTGTTRQESQMPSLVTDVAGPIVGDQWEELGLLYDGQRLEIFRNGRLVGYQDKDTGGGTLAGGALLHATSTVATDHGVHLGHGQFTSVLLPPAPPLDGFPALPAGDQERFLRGTMDDARLYRLAVDRAALLPSGISPQDDYRLTMHPDGRVESSPGPDLLFALTTAATAGDDLVTVTVTSDGEVTSATRTGP